MRIPSIVIMIITIFALPIKGQSNLYGTWQGQIIRDGFEWETRLHIGKNSEGEEIVQISFPDWGMFRLSTGEIKMSQHSSEFKILWSGTHINTQLEDEIMIVTLKGRNQVSGKLHKVYEDPHFFQTEEVTYQTDDGEVLRGTIIFPDTEPPYNGMVLTHGSGPDTRNTGPYSGKGFLAVENGLAVLIYDKRGAGESTGSGFSTINRLTKDALGMIQKLKKHPKIKSVGIGGISQGAWVAPKVAYEDPDIAFVFTTATPGVTAAEQNVYTLETRIDADTVDFAKKALRTLYNYYRTNDPEIREKADRLIHDDQYNLIKNSMFQRLMFSNGEIPKEVDPGFWAEAMFEDPLVWWSEIKVPVASFSGKADKNVPTVLSNKLIKAALEDAGNSNFELHLFPNAGHGLTLENLPKNDFSRMAYGFVPMMGAWFKEMAGLE